MRSHQQIDPMATALAEIRRIQFLVSLRLVILLARRTLPSMVQADW
jgi:hypothetical protein